MVGLLKLRLLACAAFVCFLVLAAANVASATTDTNTTDPNVTVTATLKSNNKTNPDIAVNGDVVTASVSVRSNLVQKAYINVVIVGTIQGLDGQVWERETMVLKQYKPGKTWTRQMSFQITKSKPRGVYVLTVTAITEGSFDPSQATAYLTVQ